MLVCVRQAHRPMHRPMRAVNSGQSKTVLSSALECLTHTSMYVLYIYMYDETQETQMGPWTPDRTETSQPDLKAPILTAYDRFRISRFKSRT